MNTSKYDWRVQAELLHQHSNKKFLQPTKRVLDEPDVIEQCDPPPDPQHFIDAAIGWSCGLVLVIAALLLVAGK